MGSQNKDKAGAFEGSGVAEPPAASGSAAVAPAEGTPVATPPAAPDASALAITPDDRYLFAAGTWYRSYDKLGAHPATKDGMAGFRFAVWNAGCARGARGRRL